MSIIERDGFLFQDTPDYDQNLMIESERLEECCNYLEKEKCKAVSIFHLYTLEDIGFLERFPWIEYLGVNSSYVHDISVVNRLPKLKKAFFVFFPIQLTSTSLQEISYTWNAHSEISHTCVALNKVAVRACKNVDKISEELGCLPRLEELVMIKPKIDSLYFCGKIKTLKRLEISYASTLKSLNGILALKDNLNSLWLENCKNIDEFDILNGMKKMERLALVKCGKIASVSFLRDLPEMRDFRFLGTDIGDGDLSPCLGYEYISSDNKKKYNFTDYQLMNATRIP